MTLFHERLLAKLVERGAMELLAKLVAWRHPGFSAHVGDGIAADAFTMATANALLCWGFGVLVY